MTDQVLNMPVAIEAERPVVEQFNNFTTGDILWALGIWSAILCLTPVIVFYMLMVA